jgi:hypothetical protein
MQKVGPDAINRLCRKNDKPAPVKDGGRLLDCGRINVKRIDFKNFGMRQTFNLVALTACACLLRKHFSRPAAAFESWLKSATAKSAAFLAPAFPMANVATGIPAGIWTMDKSESRPFKLFVSIGTPRTGTVVMEATTPGSAAAPPAPAINALTPKWSIATTKPPVPWGAVRREHLGHNGNTKFFQDIDGALHRFQIGHAALR